MEKEKNKGEDTVEAKELKESIEEIKDISLLAEEDKKEVLAIVKGYVLAKTSNAQKPTNEVN